MKSVVTYVALAATALALGSCVENAATGKSHFSIVGEAQERAIGQSTAESSIKQYGLYKPNSATTRYVTDLCQKMFSVT